MDNNTTPCIHHTRACPQSSSSPLRHQQCVHVVVRLILAGFPSTLCLNSQQVVVHADFDVILLVPGEVAVDTELAVRITVVTGGLGEIPNTYQKIGISHLQKAFTPVSKNTIDFLSIV